MSCRFIAIALLLLPPCVFSIATAWASGASKITATATATVVEDIMVTGIEPLNFGFITPSATGGTVTVSPDHKRSATGDVRTSLAFTPATFDVHGTPGHNYTIHTPPSLIFSVKRDGPRDESTHLASDLTVKDFVISSDTTGITAAAARLDKRGQDRIYLGATLIVPPDAVPGIYRGEVPLTVSY